MIWFKDNTRQDLEAALVAAYPNEGAGLLLGREVKGGREVVAVLVLPNQFAAGEQHHRFLLTPEDMLRGEREAVRRGLDVIGVFHSHPDHVAEPSAFDGEHALPWYIYTITTVAHGRATVTRAWQLRDDRGGYDEHTLAG